MMPMMPSVPPIFIRVTIMAVAPGVIVIRSVLLVSGANVNAKAFICHTGPLMDGTPATGRTVAYPGASFVQVEGDKIRSEQTYVDRQTVAEWLKV